MRDDLAHEESTSSGEGDDDGDGTAWKLHVMSPD